MNLPGPTAPQARILWTSLTALAIGVLAGLIGLLLWGLGWVINQLSPVLLPLAVAGILAYLLDPVVDFLERRLRRSRAIALVFFLALAIFLALVGSVVPRLIEEINALNKRLPSYISAVQADLTRVFQNPTITIPERWHWWRKLGLPTGAPAESSATNPPSASALTNAPPAVERGGAAPSAATPLNSPLAHSLINWISQLFPRLTQWLGYQLAKAFSWASFLIGFAFVPVYTFYFLWEKKGISENWTDYLPLQESAAKTELVFILNAINDYLILFFRGQVLVALCDGLLLTLGFVLVGLDFSILLGIVAGMLSIIPYLGIIMSLVPALTLAAIQFGDWLHPLLVLLTFLIVQSLEGLVISPKIMGDRVGLHPLTIIVAVLVGTTLMGGILGGILAIPLTAALRVLMFRYVWKKSAAPRIASAA